MKYKNTVLLFMLCSFAVFSQNNSDEKSSLSVKIPEAENNIILKIQVDESVKIDGKPLREIFELYNIKEEVFLKYKGLNEAETRLTDYKDNDEKLIAKLILLNYVNKSRVQYKVEPLEMDILASRVANRMSKEAAENGFHGHWNLRGEKPYHRYAFAGGLDHISENASAYYSSAKISSSFENIIELMKNSHKRFMAEKAPKDGHKKNVIAKDHNYAGLGYHLDKKDFRYYEKYINRYLDINIESANIILNDKAEFSFKPVYEGLYPYAVVVYREAPLKKMTPDQINRKGSYPDYSKDQYAAFWPWQLNPADDKGYTHVSFRAGKIGTYYVHVYLSKKEYTKGRSASVRGKIRASGFVFKVE